MHSRLLIYLLLLACLASACSISPQATATVAITPILAPTQSSPVQDPYLRSSGEGEPRTSGYWLIWSSCGPGSQAAVAQANGGREAGWVILDDLLADPGILIGRLKLGECLQGVNMLQGRDLAGADHSNDPAYSLAVQLLAAQLNLAVGTESCPAVEQAVQAAQLLLVALGFDGSGGYLGPPAANQEVETASLLAGQLLSYNTGELCR